MNYADSHRRSESIGSKNADNAVYGPLRKAAPTIETAFFPPLTAERQVEVHSNTLELDALGNQFDLKAVTQLPE